MEIAWRANWCRRLAAILLACWAAQSVAASDVRNVRLWRSQGNTRLVFDLSGPVHYGLFSLSSPNRIVLDISDADMKTKLEQLHLAGTPITAIRSGEPTAGKLRVVMDLSSRVSPKSFLLAPNKDLGNRLVVDLLDQGARSPDVAPTASVAKSRMSSPRVATTRFRAPAAPVATSGAAAPVKNRRQPSPMRAGARDIVIVIDPGHGGKDPGALGHNGRQEKDVTLAIARQLQRQINAQKGYRAELTRNGDYFIPLRGRTAIARRKHADLFVSIHADAAPSGSATGASVFALSPHGATSETARWLADTENKSDLIGGTGNLNLGDKDQALASVLLDLSMTASMASSLNVGQQVLGNIGTVSSLHGSRVEQAGFVVLKSPDIPSILVETGFITTPQEAALLFSPSHQTALARSICRGVQSYFAQNPPHGTYIAALRDAGKLAMGGQSQAWRSDDL